MDTIYKASATVDDVNRERREVTAILGTPSVDRDNEVVLPEGLEKRNYAGITNLLNHNPNLPIGKTSWVKGDKDKIIGRYTVTGKTALGNDVFELLKEGILSGHSMGFIPSAASPPTQEEIAANPSLAGVRRIHRRYELVEFGPVSTPANRDALTVSVRKSLSPETLKLLDIDGNPLPEPVQKDSKDTKLNRETVTHARALIREGKVEKTADWSFTPADGDALLGPDKDDWTAYACAHLGVDEGQTKNTKARWNYPIIKDGKVWIHGLHAAEGRASAQGLTAIAEAAKGLFDEATGESPKATKSSESIRVNRAGVSHAKALIREKKIDNGPWDFTAADGNALLGPDGDDWVAYSAAHIGVDDAETVNTKARWKYPVIKDGKVFTHALSAAQGYANRLGLDAIADTAKELHALASPKAKCSEGYLLKKLDKHFDTCFAK